MNNTRLSIKKYLITTFLSVGCVIIISNLFYAYHEYQKLFSNNQARIKGEMISVLNSYGNAMSVSLTLKQHDVVKIYLKSLTHLFVKSCIFKGDVPLVCSDEPFQKHQAQDFHFHIDISLDYEMYGVPYKFTILRYLRENPPYPFIFSLMGHFFLFYLANKFLKKKIFSPLEMLSDYINLSHNEKQQYAIALQLENNSAKEIFSLWKVISEFLIMKEKESIVNAEKDLISKTKQMHQQLAHDIRSPLAALTVVTQGLAEIAEDKRILVRSAVQRIEDIANDLAYRGRRDNEDTAGEEEFKVHFLSSLIEPLISEKRMQYRLRRGIQIEFDLKENSYGLFSKISPVLFKRVLSNLINNSVEALKENGVVKITLFSEGNDVKISVIDNGNGISPEVLPKLMKEGATFGKEKGSGLGLYHARQTLESWGGKIEITSCVTPHNSPVPNGPPSLTLREGKYASGTTVTITLPRHEAPNWFVPQIKMTSDMSVVILDDDNSIHQVWQGRFEKLGVSRDHIFHFTSPHAIISWYQKNNDHAAYLFLCDYEILGDKKNGLEVIEELKIGHEAILVTSHFEEENVKAHCKRLGVKLLPKNLAGFVPIKIVLQEREENKKIVDSTNYILIDDSEMNRDTWKLIAKSCNENLVTFSSPDEFYKNENQFDKNVEIYIDSDLAQNRKGEEVAKDLYQKGFHRIYLCTGYAKKDFPTMPWIKDIVGKMPPFLKHKY